MVDHRFGVGLVVIIGFIWLGCASSSDPYQYLSFQPLSQEKIDLAFIIRVNPIPVVHNHDGTIPFNSREPAPVRLFSTGLIRIYQQYISSQDLPACNFSPTCSQFGMGSIQQHGFLRGVLLTADRLIRDNGIMMDEHYHLNESTGRYIDPVESYAHEALIE